MLELYQNRPFIGPLVIIYWLLSHLGGLMAQRLVNLRGEVLRGQFPPASRPVTRNPQCSTSLKSNDIQRQAPLDLHDNWAKEMVSQIRLNVK